MTLGKVSGRRRRMAGRDPEPTLHLHVTHRVIIQQLSDTAGSGEQGAETLPRV
jgi:hypothetical protein